MNKLLTAGNMRKISRSEITCVGCNQSATLDTNSLCGFCRPKQPLPVLQNEKRPLLVASLICFALIGIVLSLVMTDCSPNAPRPAYFQKR